MTSSSWAEPGRACSGQGAITGAGRHADPAGCTPIRRTTIGGCVARITRFAVDFIRTPEPVSLDCGTHHHLLAGPPPPARRLRAYRSQPHRCGPPVTVSKKLLNSVFFSLLRHVGSSRQMFDDRTTLINNLPLSCESVSGPHLPDRNLWAIESSFRPNERTELDDGMWQQPISQDYSHHLFPDRPP
jgi:hypothetical protein